MRKFRFSISTLMLLVVPVAMGFGALRNPTALTAGCVFGLTVGLLLFGLVGTVARQGDGRLPYLGFTAFGTGYLGLAYLTGALTIYPRPSLPTVELLQFLSSVFPVGNTPPIIIPGFSNMNLVQMGGVYVTQERFWFDQTGHYLLALLIGLFGSVLARVFRDKHKGPNTSNQSGATL